MANPVPNPIAENIRKIAEYEKKRNQSYLDCESDFEGHKWYKEGEEYKQVKKGNEKPETVKLSKENTCDPFGLDGENCAGFLKILENYKNQKEQIAALIAFAREFDWSKAQTMLTKIHPRFILYLLHAFGFVIDIENNCIVDVDYWIKNILPKHIVDETALNKFIVDNENLLKLLACLVNFINENPGILQGDEYYTVDEYEAKIKKDFPETDDSKIYSIRFDSLSQAEKILGNNIMSQNNSSLLPFLLDGPNLSSIFIPGISDSGLVGGFGGRSVSPSVQIGGKNYTFQLGGFYPNNSKCGASYAKSLYAKFKDQLRRHNKEFSKVDEDNFKKMIENLEKYEAQVFKHLEGINNYVKSDSSYSNSMKTIPHAELQKYIRNYNEFGRKLRRQEGDILQAIFNMARIAERLDDTKLGSNEREITMADIL